VLCSPVEGSHWNEGLLLGRPPEEPEQPLTENSLLEVLDGTVMMYNLSVHQQLGKVCTVSPFMAGCMNTSTLAWGALVHTDTLLPGPDLYCICRKRPNFGNFAGWVQTRFLKAWLRYPRVTLDMWCLIL
jgi:hypothetical protein